MSDDTKETEVQKVETEAKSLAVKIEEFFAHLFEHTPPEKHADLQQAKQATATATADVADKVVADAAPVEAPAETAPKKRK